MVAPHPVSARRRRPPPPPQKYSPPPAAPAVGVIVQWDGTHWIDDGPPAPKTGDAGIPSGFSLPDVDVAVVNANTGAVSSAVSGVGTNNFNIAVDPSAGTLYVTNTAASNRPRFRSEEHPSELQSLT